MSPPAGTTPGGNGNSFGSAVPALGTAVAGLADSDRVAPVAGAPGVGGAAEPGVGEPGEVDLASVGAVGAVGGLEVHPDSARTPTSSATGIRRGRSFMAPRRARAGIGVIRRSSPERVRCVHFW